MEGNDMSLMFIISYSATVVSDNFISVGDLLMDF